MAISRDQVTAPLPAASVVEISERMGVLTDLRRPVSPVIPDEVLINGQPMLIDRNSITLQEVNPGVQDSLTLVTLTLIARQVTSGAERGCEIRVAAADSAG